MVVITGANSILGYELAKFLSQKSFKVIGTFRNKNTKTEKLRKIPEINLIKIDLSNRNRVNKDFPDGEVLIHTVASHGENLSQLISSNIICSENVSKKASNLSFKKIIYISSISIYGSISNGIIDRNTPINNPSIYGLTKYLGELCFKKNFINTPCVVLRLPAILARGSVRHFLSQVLANAKKDEPINAYNPNALFNNAVDINYLCTVITKIINSKWIGFKAFPIGCSEPILIKEVINIIIKALDSKSKVNYFDKREKGFIIDFLESEKFFQNSSISTTDALRMFVNNNHDHML